MNNYREVFGEILADHHESPRHYGELAHPTRVEDGYNPLCGDKVHITMAIEGNLLKDLNFTGEGCSICMAASSIMSEMLHGKTIEESKDLIEKFRRVMQGEENVEGIPGPEDEADIVALYGVKRFPVRIKCALLPFTTLKKGLEHAS